MRNWREWISLNFLIFSPFPHSLSIFSQPGCQAATIFATLVVTMPLLRLMRFSWTHRWLLPEISRLHGLDTFQAVIWVSKSNNSGWAHPASLAKVPKRQFLKQSWEKKDYVKNIYFIPTPCVYGSMWLVFSGVVTVGVASLIPVSVQLFMQLP